jgi:CRP-like cAMP-binding protein
MPDDYVVKKDEFGTEMFFILDGSVDIISSDHSTMLTTLHQGEIFGEVALILGLKRIANVKARTFLILSVLGL